MSHPNGAVSLAEVAICVEDVGATCAKLGALFGMEGRADAASGLGLPHGNVYVLNQDGLAGWTPVEPPTCRMSPLSASA